MNFSIVIPLFNESENINDLNNEILGSTKVLQNESGHNFELVYIDDGSTDNTFEIINNFKNPISTVIVKNSRNLSQCSSILNGIEVSTFDNIILLDGDRQNDPNDFIPMVNEYSLHESVIVHGYRKYRNDPYWSKVLPSKIANSLIRTFTNSKLSDHGCALRVFNKKDVEIENLFGDFNRLFAAQISQKKIKIVEVEVNHRKRTKGISKYGIDRIFRVLIDLIFINFTKNERSYFYTIGFLGLASFFLSMITFIYMIYKKIFFNVSFIETPLPIIVIFFALTGLIFFSIVLMLETIKKMITDQNSPKKNYTVYKKN